MCEYCENINEYRDDRSYSMNDGIVCDTTGYYIAVKQPSGQFVDVLKVEYCPLCGRKLKDVEDSEGRHVQYDKIYNICQPVIDWLKENYPDNHKAVMVSFNGLNVIDVSLEASIDKTSGEKQGCNEISHPKHYCFGKYEPVKVIQDWNLSFCLGNVLKYLARAGKKPGNSTLQDLLKAKQYLEFEIEETEK